MRLRGGSAWRASKQILQMKSVLVCELGLMDLSSIGSLGTSTCPTLFELASVMLPCELLLWTNQHNDENLESVQRIGSVRFCPVLQGYRFDFHSTMSAVMDSRP